MTANTTAGTTTGASILVTGATGFVGSHLTVELLRRGHRVRAIGRNLEKGRTLRSFGAEFLPVDLSSRASVAKACEGMSAVVHSGAIAAAWAPKADLWNVNVGGTRRVIDGCLAHGVSRLIYVSTPAVLSRFRDQRGLSERDAVPKRFVSEYARTKYEGERAIHAVTDRLETVIIRPKAVYGPGDNAVLPRVLAAARAGRLPRIGDGHTLVNLTWVGDVVDGIIAALERSDAVGRTYVLGSGEEVRVWDVIDRVLEALGVDLPTRQVPVSRLMKIARGLEAIWDLGFLSGEPPLTRYGAGILAYSQTYDISAARRDLGFDPKIMIDEGVSRFIAAMDNGQAEDGVFADSFVFAGANQSQSDMGQIGAGPAPVATTFHVAGTCRAPRLAFTPEGRRREMIDVPALIAHFVHPTHGHILWDTGYARRFFDATQQFPARVFRWLTPPTVDASSEAAGRLRAAGIAPDDVRFIILSHFDPDHYGGLLDFPNARIICTEDAWRSVRGKSGLDALKARVLPGHLPANLSARLDLLPPFTGPSIGPFYRSHDIFGDGVFRCVELPGHAPGQIGMFVTTTGGRDIFLAADGCWTRASLRTTPPWRGAHWRIASNRELQLETYDLLAELQRTQGESLTIVPSHCPEAAAEVLGWSSPV